MVSSQLGEDDNDFQHAAIPHMYEQSIGVDESTPRYKPVTSENSFFRFSWEKSYFWVIFALFPFGSVLHQNSALVFA